MIFNTPLYAAGFASDLIRGVDELRPWDLNSTILSTVTTATTILDIGTGDARKMVPLAAHVHQISAIEPSPAMRTLAQERIASAKIKNIHIIDGRCENLPFPNNSFDLVTSSLAPWDEKEVYRVLKPGGLFINETIGCEDKLNFKMAFGKDMAGNWRGQLMSFDNVNYIPRLNAELEPFFNEINIRNGFWNTYYTKEGLLQLCLYTSTIKGFNLEEDHSTLEDIAEKLMAKNGTIKLMQNRLLIMAKKKQ